MNSKNNHAVPAIGGPFDGSHITVNRGSWHVAKPADDVAVDYAGDRTHITPEELEEKMAKGLPINPMALYSLQIHDGKAFFEYVANITVSEHIELSNMPESEWRAFLSNRS